MEGRFNNLVPRDFLLKNGWGPGDEVGDLTDGSLRYKFGGLIFGGAYTWRGLFSEFYSIYCLRIRGKKT